ncbi:MAG: HlyD family efflux transporter periplasmic adaptor subunit [Leptolyngbyaceae cyanobacterium RU_5_1]|nr:HlyD family efflux transporter periplasmic adaptor subunit [Leptolyngbyaceae cyanobacterium RU_5_1]
MVSNSNSEYLPLAQDRDFFPPISRWTSWSGVVLVAIVGIAVALTAVIKYKTTVKGQASVRPVGELRLVQTATEGSVKQIFVQENQVVKSGDLIATIDDSRLKTKQSQLQNSIQQAQLQRTQIDAQIQALSRQIQAETSRIHRVVSAAEADLAGRQRTYHDRQITTRSELAAATAELRAGEAALRSAQVKYNRYRPVTEAGALPRDRLEDAQLEVRRQEQIVAAAQAKLQSAQAALNPTDAEVAIAAERIAQERASGEASLATLNKEQQGLIQQRIAIHQELERNQRELQQVKRELQQTKITATAHGIVFKLNLRNPGQTVQAGQEIAQIVPQQATLQIKAGVIPQERSKLQVGQQVQMRLSACPYPDYGTLKGVVRHISEDTIKPQANTSNPTPPFYEVTIQPKGRSLGRGRHQCAIKAGMEGHVDIISREETVLQFLLRKARLSSGL